jgi:hypothetical protein
MKYFIFGFCSTLIVDQEHQLIAVFEQSKLAYTSGNFDSIIQWCLKITVPNSMKKMSATIHNLLSREGLLQFKNFLKPLFSFQG